jgi:drug/metabolite transporter (DMT)-like permease
MLITGGVVRHGGVGLLLALVSAATFGSSGIFATSLFDVGWTPGAAVIVRVGAATLLLTAPALVQLRGRWRMLVRSAPVVATFGVVAVGLAQVSYFNAVERIPVGVALLLEYLGTVLVVGWMWVRHGQRPRRLTVAGAAVAIFGLSLVLDLGGVHHLDPAGVIWGLAAAVGLAAYFVLSASRQNPLPPLVMAWAALAAGTVVLGMLASIGALPVRVQPVDVTLADHRVSWIMSVIGLALFATVIPYVAGIAATRRLGARLASFVGLAEVLAAIALAWVLLGQVPAVIQFAGGILILTGVALVRVDELRGTASSAWSAPAPA